MKPSRILKSAWQQAGKPDSLRSYADHCLEHLPPDDSRHVAARRWRANKAKQRRLSVTRQAAKGRQPTSRTPNVRVGLTLGGVS
jgi:hypothetical protein